MNPTRTLDADVSMDQENAERPPNGDARPARRDRDAKQRSARDSFIERVAAAGFRNTRIEDVCRDVGVSHREFYRWFGNKDQCYLSIFDTFGRSLIDVGRADLRRDGGAVGGEAAGRPRGGRGRARRRSAPGPVPSRMSRGRWRRGGDVAARRQRRARST